MTIEIGLLDIGDLVAIVEKHIKGKDKRLAFARDMLDYGKGFENDLKKPWRKLFETVVATFENDDD